MDKRRALIVDDNPQNVQILELLLTAENMETHAIATLKELDTVIAAGDEYQVVFLDVELPDGDAIDWFQANKNKIVPPERFQVVGYSVHISEIYRAREAGFDSFLGKPIDGGTFSELLRKILMGDKVWSTGV